MPKLTRIKSRERPGSYTRGVEARAIIIKVAIEMFGRQGFDQASTRGIATRAKVNLGALQYYFGSKKKLYLACAEHIAYTVESRLDALVAISAARPISNDASLEQQREVLEKFLSAAIDKLLIPSASSAWLQFINREQMWPGPAFEILYERVIWRLVGALSTLVAPIIGEPSGSEGVVLQTVALLGPLFIFQRAPVIALRALSWPDFNGDRFLQVKSVLIRQSLHGLMARSATSETTKDS